MHTTTLTQEADPFSRLDIAFSQFLYQHSSINQDQKKQFETIISKLSFHQTTGHNCIHINQAEKHIILASGLITPNKPSPLVLEDNRLYLYRHWLYEHRLACQIRQRLSFPSPCNTITLSILNAHFTPDTNNIDWQKEAAKKATKQLFSIITGGPGTGKTTTVIKILAILLEEAEIKKETIHIALAAPTGKAAKQLQDSINSNRDTLPCPESVKKKIPTTASTLHQLLGSTHLSPYFKHNAQHPLNYDIVIIDETSMVDLALLSKLVDALKPNCRLILLGDKDQLASVESGAVLNDITKALPKYTLELKKSHRFQGEIKDLADAVNSQLCDKAWEMLRNGHKISLLNEKQIDYAAEQYMHYLTESKNNTNIKTIFSIFNQFQILCATRHGEDGMLNTNNKLEENLAQQNKIKPIGQWYIGRPIMITQNNAETQLYNGDIGIFLHDRKTKEPSVFFLQPNGNIKKITPNRLPEHETTFATTIHKSQGSEFDKCLCILPKTMNPTLSKELIYTAITRAKKTLKIQSTHSIFSQALQNKITRSGGLFEKLSKTTNTTH